MAEGNGQKLRDATLSINEEQMRRLENLVGNAVFSRTAWLQKMLDDRRNINHECGYPEENPDAEKYRRLWERDCIASRVVNLLPRECWQTQPEVFETEDERETPFEQSWDDLPNQLRGNSQYRGNEGNPIWEALARLDELAGIGHYGVLLLGFDDGKELSEPVEGVVETGSASRVSNKFPDVRGREWNGEPWGLVSNAKPKSRKLVYLRPFPEHLAQIVSWETNPTSPRWGQPTAYLLTFNDVSQSGSVGAPMASRQVHWTRVIHLPSDPVMGDEVAGTPRMRPVLNRLMDLQKIYAADGEGFWKSAISILALETHPQLGGDVQVDSAANKDAMEQLMNGLQRWAQFSGMSLKTISPNLLDPKSHIEVHIEAICIEKGCPVRIFKGSERGELASGQDESTWTDRVKSRQNLYCIPRAVVPLTDRLILAGVLVPPGKDGYRVFWPDLANQSDADKATVANTLTTAITAYVGGNGEALMTPRDFMVHVLKFPDDVVESILEAAEAAQIEKEEEQAALAEEQGLEPAPPPGFARPEPDGKQQPVKLREGEKLVDTDGNPLTNANPEGCNQYKPCSVGGDKPAPGSRAARAKAAVEAAKQERRAAFDELKTEAAEHLTASDSKAAEQWDAVGELISTSAMKSLSKVYGELESNIGANEGSGSSASETMTAAERFANHGDTIRLARKFLESMEKVPDAKSEDDERGLSPQDREVNTAAANRIIRAAQEARDSLRRYAEARKEMRAIRTGEDFVGNESDIEDLSYATEDLTDNWCNQHGGDTCKDGGGEPAGKGEGKEEKASLSARVTRAIKGKVSGAYKKFSERYGTKGAIAIMAAMAVTLPIPGNILGVMAAAEGIKRASDYLTGNGIDMAAMADDAFDLWKSIAEEAGIDAGAMDKAALVKALEAELSKE